MNKELLLWFFLKQRKAIDQVQDKFHFKHDVQIIIQNQNQN